MSTTLQNVVDDVRSMLTEPVARFFAETEIYRWINQGQKAFSSKVLWYERIAAQKVVGNQAEYPMPSDFLKLELVVWNESYRLRVIDESEWMGVKYQRSNQTSVIPQYALPYPFDKKVALHPAPLTTGASTTLAGNINATDTTINVVSTTSFPSAGRFIVGTEQIRYYATTSTAFLQCSRGEADTTAVNHSGGDTVDYGALVLYGRALPPDLSSPSDIFKLPDLWIESLVLYAVHKGLLKRGGNGDLQKGMTFLQKFQAMVEEAARERYEQQKDGSFGIKDAEFDMGWMGEM